MNKFLNKIFFQNAQHYRAKETPLINCFETIENFEYSPRQHQTLYHFMLQFKAEAWISGNEETNKIVLHELRDSVSKRLHHEIFGDIESYIHELQLHLHNQDYTASKKTVDLIKAAIKGD